MAGKTMYQVTRAEFCGLCIPLMAAAFTVGILIGTIGTAVHYETPPVVQSMCDTRCTLNKLDTSITDLRNRVSRINYTFGQIETTLDKLQRDMDGAIDQADSGR